MKIYVLSDISLISSNVAGSSYPEYVPATPYATGNKVKVSFESNGTTPRFPVYEYESLADANSESYPPDSPDKWSKIGAENRCKMFDEYGNTQTINSTDIELVLTANGFDCVALFGIYGTDVTLTLKHAGSTVKTETIDLRTIIPASGWYSWLYNSYEWGITQILWEFPRYVADATLEVTITARLSQAACAILVMGNAKQLGITKQDAKVGISDFSNKETDDLGRTYLNQGNYADDAEIEMWLTNDRVDYVKRQLTSIRGLRSVFNLNNAGAVQTFQSLQICGFPGDFDIIIPGAIRSKCSLEVKGLI